MRIVDLPLEVLLLVYQSLSDIDDALHLGRACKRLNNIFDNPFSRVNIFRVIIVRIALTKDSAKLISA